jgi:hypothetical protein
MRALGTVSASVADHHSEAARLTQARTIEITASRGVRSVAFGHDAEATESPKNTRRGGSFDGMRRDLHGTDEVHAACHHRFYMRRCWHVDCVAVAA